MQNKGVIRLFAVIFALASLFELSFSYIAGQVESDIQAKYGQDAAKVQYALDSMSNEVVYDLGITSYTFKEVKSKEMNLGLDLRGGMNVILEVSVRDVLKGLVAMLKMPSSRRPSRMPMRLSAIASWVTCLSLWTPWTLSAVLAL